MKYDLRGSTERMHRMVMEEKAKRENKTVEEIERELESQPASYLVSQEYVDSLDVPGAMDDGVALLLYIVVMVVGVIFKARLLLWIAATIVYLSHVFRRQIHKANWEREHKNK